MSFRFAVSLLVSICWTVLPVYSQDYPPPPNGVVSAAINSFSEYDTGRSADDIVAMGGTAGVSSSAPVIFARSVDPDSRGGVFGAAKASYPSAHIASLVGRSDFVGVGTPLARWTYPLPRHSFAVSVYLVEVTQVGIPGKDNYTPGARLYIARAGGPFTIDGRYFRAIDPVFQLFHLNEPYLFFGTRIGTNLLKVDAEQVLKLDGVNLSEASVKHEYEAFYKSRNLQDVLNEATAASSQLSVPSRGQR